MDDELILRICNQIQDTLASERENAANVLKAELERQHVRMVSNLLAQLRSQDTDLKGATPYSLLVGEGAQEYTEMPVDLKRDVQLLDSSQRYQQREDGAISASLPTKGKWGLPDGSDDIDDVLQERTLEGRKARRPSLLDQEEMTGLEHSWMHNVVVHPRFEVSVLGVVALSILAIAIDVQVCGLDLGYKLGYQHITSSPEVVMPWIRPMLNAFDFMFGVVFTIEMVLKIAGWQHLYFQHIANWLDMVIVMSWLAEVFLDTSFGSFSPFILRLVRLLKIFRLLRLARHVEYLDSLFLLVESIKASKSIVFWSTLLLVVIQMGVAIVLNQALRAYMEDETNSLKDRQLIFMYFGTFFRANVTMFEVTFGNFTTVLRLLQDIWEWYALVIITFKVLVGFVALRIISGIFMTETLRLCSSNDLIMVMQRKRKQKQDLEKMTRLFRAADHSGDGHVTEEEFLTLFEEDMVRIWLAAQELHVVDPSKLFRELAGDDETITANEMMEGVTRMRGFARATDIAALMKDHQGLVEDHKELMVQHTEMHRDHGMLISMVRAMDIKIGKLVSPADAVLMYAGLEPPTQGTGPAQRISNC